MQGSAVTGLMAMSGNGPLEPAWPRAGMMNDYFTGYSAALAVQSALIRRTTEGGAWSISASLCASAMAYEKFFGFVDAEERAQYKWGSDELDKEHKFVEPRCLECQTPKGWLRTLAPLTEMSETPARWEPTVLVPLGSSLPHFLE